MHLEKAGLDSALLYHRFLVDKDLVSNLSTALSAASEFNEASGTHEDSGANEASGANQVSGANVGSNANEVLHKLQRQKGDR